MNVVAYASLAFLIVSILACSFVAYRVRPRSYKAGDTLPLFFRTSFYWMRSHPWSLLL